MQFFYLLKKLGKGELGRIYPTPTLYPLTQVVPICYDLSSVWSLPTWTLSGSYNCDSY